MTLYVAYFRFKEGSGALEGLQAFDRRRTFEHPSGATVLGEFWANPGPGLPQVVLIWEAEDEAPGDYYEAAWGDLFDITIAPATRPVTELPPTLPQGLGEPATG